MRIVKRKRKLPERLEKNSNIWKSRSKRVIIEGMGNLS